MTNIFACIVQVMDIGGNGGYGFKGDQSVSACLVMEIEECMVSTEPRVFLVQCH